MAFFEKVGGTLAAKGRDMADKAREMAEVNRLNGLIHAQKSMEEKLYMEIGRLVYENREDWQSVDVAGQLEQLDTIREELSRLQKEILCTKGMRQCENCGAEIDRSASFCPKCGLPVVEAEEVQDEEKTQESQETSAYCPGCNKEVEPESVFCPFCGMKMK